MVFTLKDLVKLYSLKISGVIHIGAHYGEEYKSYVENKIKNLIFVEPLPDNYHHLLDALKPDFPSLESYPERCELFSPKLQTRIFTYNLALGNQTGKMQMFVETVNQSQSSSVLKPKQHLQQYPHITFDEQQDVCLEKLDRLMPESCFNTINIDVQGYELEVFKGGVQTLAKQIDYVYTEVNRAELYENCAQIAELDSFLSELGFIRVIVNWIGDTWGDALYIKRHLAPNPLLRRVLPLRFARPFNKLFR